MNRLKDNSSTDAVNPYSSSYLIDTDLGYNNNNLSQGFMNEFKMNTSVSGSLSAPTSLSRTTEHFTYPNYTPTLDYIQCIQSADESYGSSCSSGTKLPYTLSQGLMNSSTYVHSNGQSVDSYFFNSEGLMMFNEVDENENSMKQDLRHSKGRGRGAHSNGARKRHVSQENNEDSSKNDSVSVSSSHGRGRHGKALARHPFIPSYMDPNNGPHLCVVCKHNASGFHYRVMACEGCKGFFRRTVQNNLVYSCKFSNKCDIQPHNRAQCQECRWRKCLEVGMAKDLVLSDEARRAKKELIAANRAKKITSDKSSNKGSNEFRDPCSPGNNDKSPFIISEEDERLIKQIKNAFDETDTSKTEINIDFGDASNSQLLHIIVDHHVTSLIMKCDIVDDANIQSAKFNFSQQFNILVIIVEPMMQRVISFAFMIPKFIQLSLNDQVVLLKNASFDIICLRNSMNYEKHNRDMKLEPGFTITKDLSSFHKLVEPTYIFASRISYLNMDCVEVSLMAALTLLSCDRLGLEDIVKVESLQDNILRSIDCYMKHNCYDNTHRQSELYATILPELRSTTSWHSQIMINSKDFLSGSLLTTIKAIYHYQDLPQCSPFVESSTFTMVQSPMSKLSSPATSMINPLSNGPMCLNFPYVNQTMPPLYAAGPNNTTGRTLYVNPMLPSPHLSSHSGQSSYTELLTESTHNSDLKLEGLLMVDQYTTQETSTSNSNFPPVNGLTQPILDDVDPVFDFTSNLL
uniref:TR-1 n=1 Tax=Dendrocoelum lacteum TaxID=27895 RepID=T1E1D3_9PLAT